MLYGNIMLGFNFSMKKKTKKIFLEFIANSATPPFEIYPMGNKQVYKDVCQEYLLQSCSK